MEKDIKDLDEVIEQPKFISNILSGFCGLLEKSKEVKKLLIICQRNK